MHCENTRWEGKIAPLWDPCECTAGEWRQNEEGLASGSIYHGLCEKVAYVVLERDKAIGGGSAQNSGRSAICSTAACSFPKKNSKWHHKKTQKKI